ncbi:U6 snRNA phosphodiesterase Usb1 [Nemania serpens]|nr:U6 snRNA phosphodiesterase Usb1 [Nemania serpens]
MGSNLTTRRRVYSEMGLVDYSSDSSGSEEEDSGPQPKRQKTTSSDKQASTTKTATSNSTTTAKSELPPLPSAFHDLYASTVRVSAKDDPTLHQGRKRVNPHKVGHWPSHLYIEWHPTPTEQTTLTTLLSTLLSTLQTTLASQTSYPPHTLFSPSSPSSPSPSPLHTPSPSPSSPQPLTITSFLTSDLGAPQPLHISLSRPLVLSTPQKDAFLTAVQRSVRASGVAPFSLAPLGLEWHRTAESARSFLVLRVGNPPRPPNPCPEVPAGPSNPQLATLLARSNALVTALGQPALYAFAPSRDAAAAVVAVAGQEESGNEAQNVDVDVDVDRAFHVSIAWSFAPPTAELRRLTAEVFHGPYNHHHDHDQSHSHNQSHNKSRNHRDNSQGKNPPEDASTTTSTLPPTTTTATTTTTTTTTFRDAVAAMRVRVDGIKAKIGNVVTHVPLPDARGRTRDRDRGIDGGGIFGV